MEEEEEEEEEDRGWNASNSPILTFFFQHVSPNICLSFLPYLPPCICKAHPHLGPKGGGERAHAFPNIPFSSIYLSLGLDGFGSDLKEDRGSDLLVSLSLAPLHFCQGGRANLKERKREREGAQPTTHS